MPVTVPRYTLQDLNSFPDDGNRYELLDGILLVTPAPELPHQRVVWRLLGLLSAYLASDRSAEVFSPGSVEVEPNIHLEPDLLVVPATALPAELDVEQRWTGIRQWWLAVEVSGKSKIYDRDHKTPAYLNLGVREVWRVDLRERLVFVSHLGQLDQPQAASVTWLPPTRQDPLVISVPQLFA
ncbi:MAG TPA: Uma2 family endonuclease [Gemmatimonadales bacterium]|nr:Uma2 family endonuclease [Gemmatimonadales bacterium]